LFGYSQTTKGRALLLVVPLIRAVVMLFFFLFAKATFPNVRIYHSLAFFKDDMTLPES